MYPRQKRTSGPVLPRRERSLTGTLPRVPDGGYGRVRRKAPKERQIGHATRRVTSSPGEMENVSAALPREIAIDTFSYASS